MTTEIVLTRSQLSALRSHLLGSRYGHEEAAYIIAGVNVLPDGIRLLAKEIIPVPPEGFESQGGAYLRTRHEFLVPIYSRCRHEGFSLVEVHSHPFSSGSVTYSSLDTESERARFSYLHSKLPDIFHATMVFGQRSVDAHFFERQTGDVLAVDLLRVAGLPRDDWLVPTSAGTSPRSHTSRRRRRMWRGVIPPDCAKRLKGEGTRPKLTEDDTERLSRQVLAFGREGQRCLALTSVGLVGAGGTGSIVAECLSRLGIGQLVIVDPDVVEASNLNRLLGAFPEDARYACPKVETIAKHLLHIDPDLKVASLHRSIYDPEALKLLKGVDVLVGATDNWGSRLVLNQLSVKYLIPYIDMGNVIEVREHRLETVSGQVVVAMPGEFCLQCVDLIDLQKASIDLMTPFQQDRQRSLGYISGADVEAPAVIFLNMTIASLAVCELVGLVTGWNKVHPILHYDAMKGKTETWSFRGADDCIACGPGSGFACGDLAPFADLLNPQLPLDIPGLQEEIETLCQENPLELQRIEVAAMETGRE